MLLSYLFQNPIMFVVWILAIIYALSVHEFSHALGALVMGDDTAKHQGRLTLNPLSHIDLWGLAMLILAGFGWGKPVPFNPYNLRNQRWGAAIVAMFGPLANLVSVIIFAVVIRLVFAFSGLGPENMLIQFLLALIMVDTILLVFNLIPIPPLDGSKILFAILPSKYNNFKIVLQRQGFFLLLALIIFDRILPVSILGSLFGFVINGVMLLVG
ncbi:site-2 protease family protein [Candidatus Falkowbacteria bacterium]|nr:site-2 protease family protein [Candidatus Falkowbacteria bacterium]